MYSPPVWTALLLLVSAAVQSSSAKRLEKRQEGPVDKCAPKPLRGVDSEVSAEGIVIFLPPYDPDEQCLLKGYYDYAVSYGAKGEEQKHLQHPAEKERLSLRILKPSTDYTINVTPRFYYRDEGRAVQGDRLTIDKRTRDLALPPVPTKEITLVDSVKLNKTEQAFEIPPDIFSDINGIVKHGDILVAQDTEIDKCDNPAPSTWEVAHSQSPIKCYNAGYVRNLCDYHITENKTVCVLGRGQCGNGHCNGELTPGVKYGLKIRGHNDAGPRDTKAVFFVAGRSSAASLLSSSFLLVGAITFLCSSR